MINRLKGGYSILPNEIFKLGLSLKAIGLYSYLNSKSTIDNYEFSYKGLTSQLKEGIKALKSAVKELKDSKLLITVPKMNGTAFNGHQWILNPTDEDLKLIEPKIGNSSESTLLECSVMESPIMECSETVLSLINTDKPITEEITTEEPTTKKSRSRVSFKSFREKFLIKYQGTLFKLEDCKPWSNETPFSLTDDGLIKNEKSNRLLNKEDAYVIWDYLYSKSK